MIVSHLFNYEPNQPDVLPASTRHREEWRQARKLVKLEAKLDSARRRLDARLQFAQPRI